MIGEAVNQIPETLATIVATIVSKIVFNSSLKKLNIEPCNHEEADTRLLLHVLDGANSGIKKVSIITVDTDVVVIALRHFLLWILKSCGLNLELTNIEDTFRFIHVQKYLVGNYAAAWHYDMHLQDVIQFQASLKKKTAEKVLQLFNEELATFAR